jgi:hypothetical protein
MPREALAIRLLRSSPLALAVTVTVVAVGRSYEEAHPSSTVHGVFEGHRLPHTPVLAFLLPAAAAIALALRRIWPLAVGAPHACDCCGARPRRPRPPRRSLCDQAHGPVVARHRFSPWGARMRLRSVGFELARRGAAGPAIARTSSRCLAAGHDHEARRSSRAFFNRGGAARGLDGPPAPRTWPLAGPDPDPIRGFCVTRAHACPSLPRTSALIVASGAFVTPSRGRMR